MTAREALVEMVRESKDPAAAMEVAIKTLITFLTGEGIHTLDEREKATAPGASGGQEKSA